MVGHDVLEITLHVAAVFERLGIDYLVGGSLASSLHGIPRATQDADLVAELHLGHVVLLVDALEDDFYIDAGMIEDAIRRRSSFNIIHLETMFKVDVFILKPDPLARLQMERRQTYSLPESPDRQLMVASPEDVVLQKLRWYELGNRISDRQWKDVLGVLKVRGKELDLKYLRETAQQMDVEALLVLALEQAGIPTP